MELYNFLLNVNGHTSSTDNRTSDLDFPATLNDVWILGKQYHSVHDIEDLRTVLRSKLWFSYRKGFPPIGGTGPTADNYWGCMLRCGQMIMAEALVCKHLGRGWLWQHGVVDPVYAKILRMFQDKKDSPYSIHQIAQMGVSEGKAIGDWFGPNTVAQVLRKLSIYDEWSSIAVHVVFDNTVIKSDIHTLCRHKPEPLATPSPFGTPKQSIWYTDCLEGKCPRFQNRKLSIDDESSEWRPMLLFIPLRLGISNFNPIYMNCVKNMFKMKQSLGIIGGRPRHAVWFIGCVGNELICLDPHVTQPTVNFEEEKFDDSSYHLPVGGSKRMLINNLDPSVAFCFFIESEEDLEDWCQNVSKLLTVEEKLLVFEIISERPPHWPPLELRPDLSCSNCSLDYFFVENSKEDDEFENIESISCYRYK